MLISIKLSLPCKNDVTYKSIEPVVVGFTHGCVFVSPAISVPKDKYDMQEKQRCMILFFPIFKAFLISSAGSLLASIKSLKNIYCGKKCNYPLTTTQGDRFASCENIVSRSQNSSLPPPPSWIKTYLFCSSICCGAKWNGSCSRMQKQRFCRRFDR